MSVYFIRDTNKPEVKIGYSHDPARRLRKLEKETRRTLQLLGTIYGGYAEEQALHRQFKDFNIRGEWFRLEGALVQFIGRKRPPKPKPPKPLSEIFRETVRDMLKAQHTHEQIAETLMMTVPVLIDYMKTNNLK